MAQFFAVAASLRVPHRLLVRILLTNDDGVNARGLRLLEAIARKLSDDIWIVAPTDEQSGAGHSLTLTEPVRLRQHDDRRFSVTGTPTDAVMLALAHVMKDSPPDVIMSGINRGANLAEDVTYSGRLIRAKEWATPCRLRLPRPGRSACLPRCLTSRWSHGR
jgi:5'-nucleotidase